MNINDILQVFVTKDKRFYPRFIASAENIVKASKLLVQITHVDDPEERKILAHRIKECETAGDEITDGIINELIEAFVTPFDRNEIHDLAEDMDSFLDCIRDSSKKIVIYQPKTSSRKIGEIADYILKDAEILLDIVGRLETMRKQSKELDKLCDDIKDIEHTVDDIYESYISNLFAFEKDPIELVKKKNIIQAFEDTSDTAKRLSTTIRSIVVRNA